MGKWYIPEKWKLRELKVTEKKDRKTEKDLYELTVREKILCTIEGILVITVFAYFFYRSLWAEVFLLPLVWLYYKERKKNIRKKKQQKMELEFKDLLLYVRSNLQAGYSMENSFLESKKDLVRIHGEDAFMVKELEKLETGLKNGVTMERLIYHLGRQSGGEIREFSFVYQVASKMGGRWHEVISNTVDIITRKIELKEEIKLLIYEKELEHKIMCIIPFVIMLYMDVSSGGYFNSLYHNPLGIILMTIALFVYLFAYKMGEKITTIEDERI